MNPLSSERLRLPFVWWFAGLGEAGAVRTARYAMGVGFSPLPPRCSVAAAWGSTLINSGGSYGGRGCGGYYGAGRIAVSPLTMASGSATVAAAAPSAVKRAAPATKTAAATRTSKKKPGGGGDKDKEGGSKNVLVIVESPAKARTISTLLKKAGGGGGRSYAGYKVDACNGHVTDLVSKRRDVPLELKEQTKGWDVVGVDVVSLLLDTLASCSRGGEVRVIR